MPAKESVVTRQVTIFQFKISFHHLLDLSNGCCDDCVIRAQQQGLSTWQSALECEQSDLLRSDADKDDNKNARIHDDNDNEYGHDDSDDEVMVVAREVPTVGRGVWEGDKYVYKKP